MEVTTSWTVLAFILMFSYQATSALYGNKVPNHSENDAPIIGILSQELPYTLENLYPGLYKSFIAASYVKFIEGGGARVVPIAIGEDQQYYEDTLSKINGVLFPGGTTWFNTSRYTEAGEHIYRVAQKMNDGGDYFPLWGTCLGFEMLTFLSANQIEHRTDCKSRNIALSLEFKSDFKSSHMFSKAPAEVISILKNQKVTANFHQYCVTEANLSRFHIDKDWRVISINSDLNGIKFISTIEGTKYPFYGVQFHPEKVLYEWVPNRNIPHSTDAVKANSYFAQFFVSEARKNHHSYVDSIDEEMNLIYNYRATYTGLMGFGNEQCYLFT